MNRIAFVAALFLLGTFPSSAQSRPDFSGVWKLDPAESRMVGAGGRVGTGPDVRQISWIIDHRDPHISVTVNVRDPDESREFSFTCTTDGKECVNELRDLNEVRRTTSAWEGDVLHMRTNAHTPHGDFEAIDYKRSVRTLEICSALKLGSSDHNLAYGELVNHNRERLSRGSK